MAPDRPPLRDPSPVTVAPLRCGNCGGSFQEGDPSCPWCNAGIALEDRGRSHVCAHCALRAPVGATWCPGCGERLGDQPLAPRTDCARCPACAGELRERLVGTHPMTECGGCGGLWLAATVLDELCSAAERAGIAVGNALPSMPPQGPNSNDRIVYRACPACSEFMTRRNHGGSSGVVVDTCRRHGIWLDHSELERLLAWVRAGGPERERLRRIERARRAEPVDRKSLGSPLGFPLERERPVLEFDVLEALSRLLRLS